MEALKPTPLQSLLREARQQKNSLLLDPTPTFVGYVHQSRQYTPEQRRDIVRTLPFENSKMPRTNETTKVERALAHLLPEKTRQRVIEVWSAKRSQDQQ